MNIKFPRQSLAFSSVILSGTLSLLLGLVVLTGWYTHQLDLIQVNSTFVPMQYNTALGFVLAGLGLLGMAFNRWYLATLSGLLTLLLSLATLIQYIAAVDLSIDQVFMQHYVNIATSHPGRMAPNTVFCLTLSGLSILLASLFKDKKSTNGVLGTLGVMILGLGIVAFTGYLAGLETAYGWGHLTKMAIHTALGFILLGVGFFAFAWYQEQHFYRHKPKWLSLPIGVVSLTVTLAFWQALVAQAPENFEYTNNNTLVSNGVLLIGTTLSLILVYLSRSILYEHKKRSAILTYIPVVVLAAGLFFGLSLFSLLHHHFQETVDNKFKAAVNSHVQFIEYGITPYLESLYSIRAGFDASSFIDREEFHKLVSRLTSQYPGIIALEWVPKVSRSERILFEEQIASQMQTDFTFVEHNDQGKITTAQQRDWYYPIVYVEPLNPNLNVLGFDLGSHPQCLKSMLKSVNINAPTASPRVQLFQTNKTNYDFIVSLPVFKQNSALATPAQRQNSLKGFALAVINVGQMIEAILSRHAGMSGLNIQFLNTDLLPDGQLLYLHTPRFASHNTHNSDGQYHYQTDATMQFADQKWKIIATSADAELYPEWNPSNLHLPIAIFILSAVLAFYLRRAGLREIERNEMLAYQTALLDAIPNPIFVFNEYQKFSSCNQAYEQFFNIRREDYLGKTLADLDYYSSDTKQAFATADLAMQNQKDSVHEGISISNQAAQKVDISYWRTAFTLGDGRPAGIIGILIDISELKQAHEAAEIAQHIAEEANQSKSDFLANMSHEIRTPMNAVIGMSYLALQTELDRKQRNYIEKVHRSAEALLGIINDILDFSKIEAGKLDMEKIDFRFEDVLENLASLLGLKAEESGLELLFDIAPDMPMALKGDPLRLGQVLINLGNNAVKFTEQGEVVLSTRVLESSAEQIKIQFSVRDTGIGMSEKQQKKLFQSFMQADGSTTRKFGGTGLGLVICKKLTKMMGGEIWVESAQGKGTTFSFSAVFEKAEEQQNTVQLNTLENLNVLVVDDNKSSREIMAGMLQTLSYTTTTVTSGLAAIETIEQAELEKSPFDLIIMDWKMPGMDGVQTIRKLKQSPELEKVPTIIMATAYAKEELVESTKDIDHLSFLTKPTNASFLFDTIMNAFGHKVTSRSRRSERQEDYTESVRQLQGAKVLLVEDNEINQELALELLSHGGINAILAENGQQAIDQIQKNAFDGVLMDIQMPIMDGYSATKIIRKLVVGKELPIIAMTANVMSSDIEQALQAGMNDHISKPINVAEMFCTMAKWISPENPTLTLENKGNNTKNTDYTLPKFNGIDTDAGMAISQGNEKLYRRLLIKFLQSEQGYTEQFQQAQQSQDKDAAMRVAHTLKGVAGNIGAGEIQSAAQALEQACNNQLGTPQIEILLNTVEAKLAPVLESLKQLEPVQDQIPVITAKINTKVLTALYQKLHAFLLDDDAGAVDVLEEIISQGGGGSNSSELQHLEKLIEQYAYDEAIDIVKVTLDNLFLKLN